MRQMNQLINMSRQQKEIVAAALLSGQPLDKYLLTLGVIHDIDEPLIFEMSDGKYYLPGTGLEIDMSQVECLVRFGLPKLEVKDWPEINVKDFSRF